MNIADINTTIRRLCDATTTSLTAANLLIDVNQAYEEIVGKIIGLDGTWQFDDSNFTDRPIATTTLVNSQNDYSFAAAHLNIERVEVLDSDGNYYLLQPIDKSRINVATTEFMEDDGKPLYYDKEGNQIILYPAPDNGVSVTLAAGLKVYFQRTASVFTSAEVTTGTKVPGFASPFHMIICYKAAIPYCISYKKDRVPYLELKAKELEKELIAYYGRREKDVRKRLSNAGISSR